MSAAVDQSDPLAGLERLGSEALEPCMVCQRHLLEIGAPIFYRLRVQQCGIEANAVKRHVGLAMAMGGGESGLVLASALGPQEKPVVVINTGTKNVCYHCALDKPDIVAAAVGDGEGDGA